MVSILGSPLPPTSPFFLREEVSCRVVKSLNETLPGGRTIHSLVNSPVGTCCLANTHVRELTNATISDQPRDDCSTDWCIV